VDSLQTLVQDRLPQSGAAPEKARAERPSDSAPLGRFALEPASRIVSGEPARDGALLHGRYRLVERLGAGGFGVVWRAHDELLHREVALKRISLPPDSHSGETDGGEPYAGERASREALATARLSHPAIVALYEAYVDDDAFYLVSELIDGDTLAQLVAQDALGDEELLEIVVILADALAHAHARGVIHRDVKPQNVLVPHDPGADRALAKLTDFGGASLAGEQTLTRAGETLGTLAYMAPEQSEGLQVGESADVYSLALIAYEGLTGANPVRGPTPAATARRVGRPLPPLSARRPDLPPTLTDALDTALAVDPAVRATLEELRSALELALAQGLGSRRRLFRRGPEPHSRATSIHTPTTARRHAPGRRGAIVEAQRLDRFDGHDPHRPSSDHAPGPFAAPAGAHHPREDVHARPHRRLPLVRAVWVGCVLAVAAWQVASARPGVALLLLAATAPLLLLGPHPGIGWLTAGLAPLLGLVGLAGAYPALAGQASRWQRRAALGALGYWWLTLAGPLLLASASSERLWLSAPSGLPPRAVWEGSLDAAAVHFIAPALTVGLVLGASLWAVAATVLPLIVRGSSAIRDTLAAVAWSAALLAATPYFDAGLSAGATLAQPRGAVLGALAGAAVAVAGRALRGPDSVRHQ
jgi:eukaryotic-like serine/threonine-protein kinase